MEKGFEIMNNNSFTVSADLDEYEVKLYGTLEVEGFSGAGSGYFSKFHVFDFCENTIKLAESMEGSSELLGQLINNDGNVLLTSFAIRVYPLCRSKLNGVIGMHITLGKYPYTDCREEEMLKVSGEIKTRNQHILQFAKDIKKLFSGEIKEAALNKGVDII